MDLRAKIDHLRQFGWRALSYRWRALLTRRPAQGHVLMVHTGRAGSTVLANMLDQHTQICWDGEIFEKKLHRVVAAQEVEFHDLYGRFTMDDLVGEFARRQRILCGSRIFGAEIQDYHLEMVGGTLPELVERLEPLGFTRFVVLERANTLRKVVSTVVATKRDAFHVARSEKVAKPSVSIDPERIYLSHRFTPLIEFLDQSRQFLDDARTLLADRSMMELYYHLDIEEDPREAYRSVCEFLGLEPQDPKVRLGRTTPQPLYETLENYDEISALLADTEHAWMAPPRDEL